MYECCTRSRPFHGQVEDISMIFRVLEGTRPKIPDDVPDHYRSIMKMCWDNDPKKRPTAKYLYDFFYEECKLAIECPEIGEKSISKLFIEEKNPECYQHSVFDAEEISDKYEYRLINVILKRFFNPYNNGGLHKMRDWD